MAQIVHGECANGGGGGGASPPETQAFSTLRPWPPRRRVPVEASAVPWDRTVRPHPPSHLPPTLPSSHLPSRLSHLSAMPSHAPPPLPTRPSRCSPRRPTMPSHGVVLAMVFVLITCYGITITCLQHNWVDDVGWCPQYGFMKRILTAICLTVLPVLLWRSPVHSYILDFLWRSTILVVESGYRYLNRKLVMVISILGLLMLALVFVGIHMPSDDSLALTRGSEIKMLNNHKHSHDRVLLSFSHETHGNVGKDDGIINTDLRLTAGNADGSGQDQKASPHWTFNQNSSKSAQDYEEKSEMQNGSKHGCGGSKIIDIVVVPSMVVVVVVAVALLVFLLWRICVKRSQQQGPLVQPGLCRLTGSKAFRYDELAAATNNFAQENKLGQGGFGPVYRGFLRDPGRHVAIKLLSAESSGQGQTEFEAEVEVLTQVRHRNIVQLVGWCQSNKGLLLVYEMMAEGSLDKHLHSTVRTLSWQQRYKIILDLGSALLYLHRCCDKCIVHGDIKPENVMLDSSFNAKLGDFGTARLLEHGAEPRPTEIVAGTRGYIDPEFLSNSLRCPDADIYSFGVALLEIVSGKRPPDLLWVRSLYDRHVILDAADGKMNRDFDRQQVERVLVTGLWCAHQHPSQRPSIEQAMDVLRCVDATLPVLPATRDPQQVRVLQELAFGGLSGEGASVDVIAASTCYLTSKDSAYLLAEA